MFLTALWGGSLTVSSASLTLVLSKLIGTALAQDITLANTRQLARSPFKQDIWKN